MRPARDFVAGDKLVVFGDVRYQSAGLRAPLRSVFAKLLDDRTRLFAGRGAVLGRVAEFIRQRAGGYLVVTAPPGFGKTALLANLVRAQPDVLAYHFFAQQYVDDSVREPFFLRNLIEQMAAWHGDARPIPGESELPELRALFHAYLDRSVEGTRVVLLDGVDEIAGWDPGQYLGQRLPVGLHVILTLREPFTPLDSARLGLPNQQTTVLSLAGLNRHDVRDVLLAAGGPAATLADQPDVLTEIMRIAAYESDPHGLADPFYVRFLAEDARSGVLTAANLAEQPLGLGHYLETWHRNIIRGPGKETLRDLLATLAVALGPIGREDLQRLYPRFATNWRDSSLDDVVESARRLVVRDGRGRYSLAHPRLKASLRELIHSDDPTLLDRAEEALIGLCQDQHSHPSGYALGFYARHLLAAAGGSSPIAESARAELFGLVDNHAWYLAHSAADPSAGAYLDDLACAWGAAEKVDASAARLGEVAPLLAREIRCALASASLRSLSFNIPSALLVRLARARSGGRGHQDTALAIAAQNPDAAGRSEALAQLADLLPEPSRRSVRERALAAVQAIQDREEQALTLARLAGDEPSEALEPLVASALELARGIRDRERRARVLTAVATRLAEPARSQLYAEAADVAVAVERVADRARVLMRLAPALPETLADDLLSTGLGLDREGWRARVLVALTPRISASRLSALRQAVEQIRNPGWRAEALAALAPRLADPEHKRVLSAALDSARAINDPAWRLRVLASLADQLTDAERDDVLDEARASLPPPAELDPERRVRALATLADHVPPSAKRAAVFEALQLSRTIEDSLTRAEILADLARQLSQDDRADVLVEALAAVRTIRGRRWRERNRVLQALAPLLSDELVGQALIAARAVGDGYEQTSAVAALATQLTGPDRLEILSDALTAARVLESPRARVLALAALARELEEPQRAEATAEALHGIPLIDGDDRRGYALTVLAPSLSDESLEYALEIARSLDNDGARVRALSALAPCLPRALLIRALESARAIKRPGWRSQALAALAAHLDEPPRESILSEARELAEANESPEWRSRGLAAVAVSTTAEREAVLSQAVAAVAASENPTWRVRMLAGLARHVADDQRKSVLHAALAEARALDSPDARGRALLALIPFIDEPRKSEVLEQVLPAVRGIENPERRARALAALSTHLARLPRAQLYPLFGRILRDSSERTRRDVLLDLAALAPVVCALGGEQATFLAARSILEIAQQWP